MHEKFLHFLSDSKIMGREIILKYVFSTAQKIEKKIKFVKLGIISYLKLTK